MHGFTVTEDDTFAERHRRQELRRALRITAFLTGALVILTILAIGPLQALDLTIDRQWRLGSNSGHAADVLRTLDNVGQRILGLQIMLVVALVGCVWSRSVRPLQLGIFAMLLVNLLVGVLKLSLARGAPYDDSVHFFVKGGEMYPSGHAANVVSIYGICAYVVVAYCVDRRWLRHAFTVGIVLLVALQFVTSLALRWHWFTDLVSGVLIGSLVLVLTYAADLVVPEHWGTLPSGRVRSERFRERAETSDAAPIGPGIPQRSSPEVTAVNPAMPVQTSRD